MRLAAACGALLLAPVLASGQMATADRVRQPGFWPTKGEALHSDYAGADACARCHGTYAASQSQTPMARTLWRAEDSEVLSGHTRMAFDFGRYKYEVARAERQSLYSVSDGSRSLQATLAWAFGFGKVGQTWFFEKDGAFHEARVSYFEPLGRLDFTPARSLKSARDRRAGDGTAGPGERGPALLRVPQHRGDGRRRLRRRPARAGRPLRGLPRPGAGACGDRAKARGLQSAKAGPGRLGRLLRRVPRDVLGREAVGRQGHRRLALAAARLQSSRCWGKGDARLTCVACHDPHAPLVRDAASYDGRCLACHARPAKTCPTATERCTTCHMPKYEVPEMHFQFTDHLIRTARAGRLSPARE
jgi:hypothetical protein